MGPNKNSATPGCILPDALYPLRGFHGNSGVTPTRIREARRRGLDLKTISVGRRKFVRGADGIAFILALAEMGTEA